MCVLFLEQNALFLCSDVFCGIHISGISWEVSISLNQLTRRTSYSVANAQQFWLRERTIDDVKVFLRKIDWDDVREVFDGARERYALRSQSGDHLRKTMRANLLKAREFLSRMSHNARIVHQWANTELKNLLHGAADSSPDQEHQLRETVQMAADFRT